MCYEPPAINFHRGERAPREPLGRGRERSERVRGIMNWSEPVNYYCERASAAFWAEPVNALTNAGFLVAALAAFVEWRRAGGRDVPVLALIAVMVLIGLGSFAFHTL